MDLEAATWRRVHYGAWERAGYEARRSVAGAWELQHRANATQPRHVGFRGSLRACKALAEQDRRERERAEENQDA